jgi:hypothetical protein
LEELLGYDEKAFAQRKQTHPQALATANGCAVLGLSRLKLLSHQGDENVLYVIVRVHGG